MPEISKARLMQLRKCEDALGFFFNDRKLLDRALTHSSYSNEKYNNPLLSNERLEFFGDSILSLVVTEYLYNTMLQQEGALSTTRAIMVCEDSLYEIAKKYNITDYILTGGAVGRQIPKAIAADSIEALIAAIYIDKSLDFAKKFILNEMDYLINEKKILQKDNRGPKNIVQEYVQKKHGFLPEYKLLSSGGGSFEAAVFINGREVARGSGSNTKAAEKDAARKAIEILGIE